MNSINLLVKKNRIFFIGCILLLITGTYLLMMKGKADSFILLNSYHRDWLNDFFISYTFVGNGVFAICVAAIYFFIGRKKKEALLIFYSFLISGIVVQIMKHTFFSPRPKVFFGDKCYSYFIKGIQFYHNNSFPSGHTATAFAMATVVILLSAEKKFQIPVLIGALLVGYSRIYLGQHFLADVLVGAFIGIVTGMGCVYVAERYKFTRGVSKQFGFKTERPVPS